MAEYGSTRFSDVARSTHAADPPRQARNLDRRNANPLLDAARETSASLWGAGPPRPSTPVDAAIDAVARPGLFDPMKNRNRLREFIDRGHEQRETPLVEGQTQANPCGFERRDLATGAGLPQRDDVGPIPGQRRQRAIRRQAKIGRAHV